jgi:hypothetical protein
MHLHPYGALRLVAYNELNISILREGWDGMDKGNSL